MAWDGMTYLAFMGTDDTIALRAVGLAWLSDGIEWRLVLKKELNKRQHLSRSME